MKKRIIIISAVIFTVLLSSAIVYFLISDMKLKDLERQREEIASIPERYWDSFNSANTKAERLQHYYNYLSSLSKNGSGMEDDLVDKCDEVKLKMGEFFKKYYDDEMDELLSYDEDETLLNLINKQKRLKTLEDEIIYDGILSEEDLQIYQAKILEKYEELEDSIDNLVILDYKVRLKDILINKSVNVNLWNNQVKALEKLQEEIKSNENLSDEAKKRLNKKVGKKITKISKRIREYIEKHS